jgi:hypothetical protein
MTRSPSDLLDARASYMTSKIALIFKHDPSLEAIEEARRLLNQITDTLILKQMERKDDDSI